MIVVLDRASAARNLISLLDIVVLDARAVLRLHRYERSFEGSYRPVP